MIRHLRRADIDPRWWDEQLAQCRNKLWYAQSWVLDRASPDWEALVDGTSGAVMPLTWRKKYGVRYLYQPFALQQLGLFSPAAITSHQMDLFFGSVPAAFRYADLCANEMNPGATVNGWITEPMTNMVLSTRATYPEHRASYSKGHLRNLKSDSLEVVEDVPQDAFIRLFRDTTERQHGPFDTQGMKALPELVQGLLDRKEGTITGVMVEGHLAAAVCWVEWNGRTIFLKSASNDAGRSVRAMFHLIDQRIAKLAPRIGVLDFAGSNDPDTKRFYAGFGAHPSTYFRLRRNTLPRWIKKLKR